MPKDARLGMVIGMSVVIAFAILFLRKDTPAIAGNVQNAVAGTVPTAPLEAPLPGLPSVIPAGRLHTIAEGETLSSIAKQYYGDVGMAGYIFRANRGRLMAPDRVPLGTALYIPEKPAGLAKR